MYGAVDDHLKPVLQLHAVTSAVFVVCGLFVVAEQSLPQAGGVKPVCQVYPA